MTQRTCSRDDCDGPHEARGLCNSHYRRGLRSGLIQKLSPIPAADRFWAKVNVDGVCWEWEGSVDGSGYGHFNVKGKTTRVHRWAYEHLVGPIPDDLVIDHLCRNIVCVMPDHLEPVTHLVNLLRGCRIAKQRAKSHCPAGHPYSGENLYRQPNGARICRECNRVANRAWYQRNKEAQVERKRRTRALVRQFAA